MEDVRNSARAIDAAYRRPGISIWQNNGEAASQSIRHVHFHVAGTLESGGTEWGRVDELSLTQTDRIAERIRAHWPSATHVEGGYKV
jgi:histidine triad (HIT) family protein